MRDNTVLSDRMWRARQKGDKSRDNTIKMDFCHCKAGARQGGDEAEAGGEGEGLEGMILYHLTGWGTGQKGDINPVTTP
jgi:hypothetical protein